MCSAVGVHPFPLAFSTCALLKNKRDHFTLFIFQPFSEDHSNFVTDYAGNQRLYSTDRLDVAHVCTVFVDVPCRGFWYVAAVGWAAQEWDPAVASHIVPCRHPRQCCAPPPRLNEDQVLGRSEESLSGCTTTEVSILSFFLGVLSSCIFKGKLYINAIQCLWVSRVMIATEVFISGNDVALEDYQIKQNRRAG